MGRLRTTVKLLVEFPLLDATKDIVPPPPLSTYPGVSVIGAGAMKDMRLIAACLLLRHCSIFSAMNHFRLLPAQRLVVGQVEQDAGHKVTSARIAHRGGVLDQFLVVALYEQVAVELGQVGPPYALGRC